MEPPSRNTRQGDTLALSTLVSGFPLGRRMSGGPVTQDECRRGRWNSEIVPSWVFLRDRNSTLSHNYLLTSGDSLWLGGSYGGRESFLELGFSSGNPFWDLFSFDMPVINRMGFKGLNAWHVLEREGSPTDGFPGRDPQERVPGGKPLACGSRRWWTGSRPWGSKRRPSSWGPTGNSLLMVSPGGSRGSCGSYFLS